MKFSLRLLYLYLFSFVGLLITVIGSVQIIDLGLKTYVFTVSEYTYYPEPATIDTKPLISTAELERRNKVEQSNQRKRQLSTSLSLILVGIPLYLYHWKTIKKEAIFGSSTNISMLQRGVAENANILNKGKIFKTRRKAEAWLSK